MSKSLFEEAIADARQLREVAEQNAKNAIIEAVTPRIREFIETQLVGGNLNEEDEDFLSSAISEEDESDEEVALDESALKSLVSLMSPKGSSSGKNSDLSAISEAFGSLSDEDQKKLISLIREEEESEEKEEVSEGAYEIDLDEIKASMKSEIKHSKKSNGVEMKKAYEEDADEGIFELDEMMDMDDDELEEAVLKLVGSADEKEAFEKLGLSGIEFEEESGTEEEVEVGEPEAAEAPPEGGEGAEAAMDEAVYEIDENMLRRELARLREAKAKKSKGASGKSHKHAAAAFGGGTLEGDVLDVDLNKGDVQKKIMKEARENRALRQQLNDYRGAVETLREQLSDLNLFNAKLLYVNKILQNKDVAPNQRRAIIEALDGASNLREAKLLYESLATSISTKNESLNESVRHTAGLASRPVTSSSARMSGAGEVDRWAILAGLK